MIKYQTVAWTNNINNSTGIYYYGIWINSFKEQYVNTFMIFLDYGTSSKFLKRKHRRFIKKINHDVTA